MGNHSVTADAYVARSPKVAARMLGDELMIISALDSSLITLNDVGAALWFAVDGATPLSDVVTQKICAQYDVALDQALHDAQDLFGELSAYGVVVISSSPIGDAT